MRGQGQQSVSISDEKVFGQGLLHPCGHYKSTLQQDDGALSRSHRQKQLTKNVIYRADSAEHDILTTKQPRSESGGLHAVWGALQKMVYHCRSFKSVQELKRRCVATTDCHKRSLVEVSANGGLALNT